MKYPTLSDGTRDWCKTCAYDGTPECDNGWDCSYQRGKDGEINEDLPPSMYKGIKQTNADRIRGMTDEELEQWFWWMHREMMNYTDSVLFVHNWLKKEAEE